MAALYDVLKFVHVLSVVFMAIPLFNLIVVNERVTFGKAHLQVDQYFETIIRGGALRCYAFQLTALVAGLALVGLNQPWSAVYTNWVLGAKLVLLLALTALLSVVHLRIQPRIDRLLAQATGDSIPAAVASQIAPLRMRRKQLAATCLFLVVSVVLRGLQVSARFAPELTIALVLLAGLFAWRVYKTRIPYGWV
jgi:hypothetical protein